MTGQPIIIPKPLTAPQSANLWSGPYGYRQGLALLVGLWTVGFALQPIKGNFPLLTWPLNGFVLAGFVALLIAGRVVLPQTALWKWLTGIPLALCSLGALLVLSLVAGIIPQDAAANLAPWAKQLGLHQVFSSWPFVLTMAVLLTNLGLTSLKWLWPFQWHHIPFLLNHVGLWVALTCGLLGAGDIARLNLILPEHSASHLAYDAQGQGHALPFAVYLKSFTLDEFTPMVLLADHHSGQNLWRKGDPMIELTPGHQGVLPTHAKAGQASQRYHIKVLRFLAHGRLGRDAQQALVYVTSNDKIDPPASLIQISNPQTGARATGWITRGGPTALPQTVVIEGVDAMMSETRPKRFESQVLIAHPDHHVSEARLEVNKPITVAGWRLYQKSYEQQIGSGAQVSIVESIRDPWLPAVYTGVTMLLIAACGLLVNAWQRAGHAEESNTVEPPAC
jgi:hypothetical protein